MRRISLPVSAELSCQELPAAATNTGISLPVPREFSYEELCAATDDFASERLLGNGVFGEVYRGDLTDPRTPRRVAVKRLTLQSERLRTDYSSEIMILGKLHHRNILKLVGWCDGGSNDKLLLVYELMAKKSVDRHLHDSERPLTWPQRYRIVLGVGYAIEYLHTSCSEIILHRDIKPSNVMLDDAFEAKLGDFGLARYGPGQGSLAGTDMFGTYVYIDPKCIDSNTVSTASDMYSFGVLLLEIATGMKPAVEEQEVGLPNTLVNAVRESYSRGTILQMADERLDGKFDERQMERVLLVGLLCVHSGRQDRIQIRDAVYLLSNLTHPIPEVCVAALASTARHRMGTPVVRSRDSNPITATGALRDFLYRDLPAATKDFIVRRRARVKVELPVPRKFSYRELSAATNNFSEDRKLGAGGFGRVYRGELQDPRMPLVAVKVLARTDPRTRKDYVTEIMILGQLRHHNLVKLVGWCDDGGDDKLLLVYALVTNGSLDDHLHLSPERLLTWQERYKIAIGIGKAIEYLHTGDQNAILHWDIKPSNVMLDDAFKAKLGDFGLVRQVDPDEGYLRGTGMIGTRAYMDPICIISDTVSTASDMYSFGVLLLEIASGVKPADVWAAAGGGHLSNTLVEAVRESYTRDAVLEMADKRLEGNFNENQMERVILVGLLCVRQERRDRLGIREAVNLLSDLSHPLPSTRLC